MKKLFLLFITFTITTTIYAQERGFTIVPDQDKCLALVIGNGTYHSGSSLGNQPINDANDMKSKLQQLGFEVMLITNATKREMDTKINEFGQKLPNYRVGLIFYAGHGLQVKNENYLVPVDAVIASESDVAYTCVPAGRLLGKMNDAHNDLNIVILDACRKNPFERKWTGRDLGEDGNGLAKMDAPTGTLISYATSPGKTASNGSGRNGLYTSKLLEYIDTPGLTLEMVFKNVRTDVYIASDEQQLPWESTSLMGNFYFAGKGNNNINDTDDIVIKRKKAKGTIKLISKTSGNLIIGNADYGSVNNGDVLTFDLSPGNYKLRIGDWSQQVNVESYKTTNVTAKSKDLPNTLYDSRDGKSYKTVEIGSQVWMAENLAYKANSGYWAYNNDQSNVSKYGYLYDWETAKQVCPGGWHLPTDEEWKQLEMNLGMTKNDSDDAGWRGTIGNKLKSTSGWNSNGNGNNSSGFSALPSGYRSSNGSFGYLGNNGYWWSSTAKGSDGVWCRELFYKDAEVGRFDISILTFGYSVRCLQD